MTNQVNSRAPGSSATSEHAGSVRRRREHAAPTQEVQLKKSRTGRVDCQGREALSAKRKTKADSRAAKRSRSKAEASPKPLRAKKMQKCEQPKVPAMLRRLDPVIEMQREDAFRLGMQAAKKYESRLLGQLEDEMQLDPHIAQPEDDQAPDVASIPLKRHQYKEIEEVSQNVDQRIGSQLFELCQLLKMHRLADKPDGQAIMNFAREIIAQIPKAVEPEERSEVELSDTYRELAAAYADKLPFDFDQDGLEAFALSMQKAVESVEAEEETDPESHNAQEGREPQIHLAQQRLGYLLLAVQHNHDECIETIDSDDFSGSLERLSHCVSEVLEEASERITMHTEDHRSVAIQSHREATFHKFSLELSDLLLLESGSINFGVAEAAAHVLIPKDLQGTEAIENFWMIISELSSSPMLWMEIATVKPPESRDCPSDQAIRACLGLDNEQELTRRHAQLFVLSALLGHLRQAKAGTCFATACLIKASIYHTPIFLNDLRSLTEKGYITRLLFKEARKFPFHARVSKEYLDTELRVDREGRILSTRLYDKIPDKAHEWPVPARGARLYESPGVIAACRSLGIGNFEGAVQCALSELPDRFPVNALLKQLALYAYNLQESALYWLRSQKKQTYEDFLSKAQFAFGSQTNHPLHRAYEQVATSMVNYFGGQYMMPSWVFWTMKEVLEHADKGYPQRFQIKYKKLIKEMYLPMITRMRYLYNHHFDNVRSLFDDRNYGVKETHFYGYQLCDTGLPADFTYSTSLYEKCNSESSHIPLERFEEYAPPHQWKWVDSEEKFRQFLTDIVSETVTHLQVECPTAGEQQEWKKVGQKLLQDISSPSFTRDLTLQLLGRASDQKKEYETDRFNMRTTPWQFGWGGDFNEVLKSYFGFGASPSKLKKYNGSPKEVLAKCINYIKNQPEEIKEGFEDPRNQIIVSSPVHVFLMRPFEPTFKAAWESDLSTNAFIRERVKKPGLAVANSRFNVHQRREILSFVANNRWTTRYFEKEDWVRQQLTQTSKELFDEAIEDESGLFKLSVDDFQERLAEIVIQSRAGDPKIGERNRVWEQRFKRVLGNCVKRLVPSAADRKKPIAENVARRLIDFARNRKDTVALTRPAARRFLALMDEVPRRISIQEFRKAVVKAAYQARCEYLCGQDPGWKGKFCEQLDSKLFSVLSEDSKQQLIASGIVTHDTNWKEEIHNIHFMFLVNPGTGKIEMARYNPDTKNVTFMEQSDWFPQKKGGHGWWQFPDNYRAWRDGPLFNVRKHIEAFMS